MLHRLGLAAATVALAALVLTGCSAPAADPPVPEATQTPEPEPTPTVEAAPPTLLVGDTSLGSIVVDASGPHGLLLRRRLGGLPG